MPQIHFVLNQTKCILKPWFLLNKTFSVHSLIYYVGFIIACVSGRVAANLLWASLWRLAVYDRLITHNQPQRQQLQHLWSSTSKVHFIPLITKLPIKTQNQSDLTVQYNVWHTVFVHFWSFVAGVIKQERFPAFEKVLWRLFHGNFVLRHAEIQATEELQAVVRAS